MAELFVIHERDNVAVALEDAEAGVHALSGALQGTIQLLEPIPRGHKAALAVIAAEETVMKHGFPIALATETIPAGAWVHTHNVKSPRDDTGKGEGA